MEIAVLGKFVLNTILPFFKDNQALKLIKQDALNVSENILAKAYDTVKKAFIKGDYKPIRLQLEELEKKPDDAISQAVATAAISTKMNEQGELFDNLKQLVEELEQTYQSEITNLLKIEGDSNKVEQGNRNTLGDKTKLSNKANIKGDNNQVIQGSGNNMDG